MSLSLAGRRWCPAIISPVDLLTIGPSNARLRLLTGVEGKAARMGHDLVIVLDEWTGQAALVDGVPQSAQLSATVASLRVDSGTGGAKPLSDKDRQTIRKNALGALKADQHPTVEFTCAAVVPVAGGYELPGTLTIAGASHDVVVDVRVAEDADGWALAARVPVVQTAYGVTPYSTMLGALRLRDEVEVAVDAVVPRPAG